MGDLVTFRWLGVASLELRAKGGHTLALDPFFSRPPLRYLLAGRPECNRALVRETLPSCDYVLVSHSHFDHAMDVPEVANYTGAVAFGSPNTCRLLSLLGVPGEQIRPVSEGDRLRLGPFTVEVLPADHGFAPPTLGPGPIPPNLRPPLRLRDYRMDRCFSFLVEVEGYRLLLLPGGKWRTRADMLFVVPVRRSAAYYTKMLRDVSPSVVVPVHWDDLFRPLPSAERELTLPAAMRRAWFRRLVASAAPGARFLVPEIFRTYEVAALGRASSGQAVPPG